MTGIRGKRLELWERNVYNRDMPRTLLAWKDEIEHGTDETTAADTPAGIGGVPIHGLAF